MSHAIDQHELERIVFVITEVLTKYDCEVDHKKIEQFTENYARDRGSIKDISSFLGKINISFDAIDTIHEYHNSLINAQAQSTSKSGWLRSIIMNLTSIKDLQKVDQVTRDVQNILIKSNNNLLSLMLNQKVEVFDAHNLHSSNISHYQDNITELLGDIQNSSYINTVSSAQQFELICNKLTLFPDQNVLTVVNNFFEGDLGNADESIIAKLIAFAFMLADEEVPIDGIHDLDPTGIAVMVDSGVIYPKIAYQLSKGKISIQRALEYIYERSIADSGLLLAAMLKAKTFTITTATCAAIGMSFGPIGGVIGGLVGASVSKVAGSTVKKGIKEGIKKIHEATKERVTQIIDKTIKAAEYVGQKVEKVGRNVIDLIRSWL